MSAEILLVCIGGVCAAILLTLTVRSWLDRRPAAITFCLLALTCAVLIYTLIPILAKAWRP